jgi:hypothetical protein
VWHSLTCEIFFMVRGFQLAKMSGSETAGSARDGERLFTPQGTVQPELDEPGSNEHQGSMVSVDFSMPLKGQARVERIRQMTNSHVRNLFAFCFLGPCLGVKTHQTNSWGDFLPLPAM